jgi:hypothetical protein
LDKRPKNYPLLPILLPLKEVVKRRGVRGEKKERREKTWGFKF